MDKQSFSQKEIQEILVVAISGKNDEFLHRVTRIQFHVFYLPDEKLTLRYSTAQNAAPQVSVPYDT